MILDRKRYVEGIHKIIDDYSKFKKLDKDPTLLRERQLQRFLRKKNRQQTLIDKVYNTIYPKGSQPARIYGLAKLHNPCDDPQTPPLRPIVSSIGAFSYNLAKYQSSILAPLIPKKYCVSDSFSFVQKIKNLYSNPKFLASFDVCSLFINIPLDETIDLAVDLIMNNNILNINRADLKKLFSFTLSRIPFSIQWQFIRPSRLCGSGVTSCTRTCKTIYESS